MHQSTGAFDLLSLMVTLELWLRVVEWWQPRTDIDVPDLPGTRSSFGEQVTLLRLWSGGSLEPTCRRSRTSVATDLDSVLNE
jgi:hypothetical protein